MVKFTKRFERHKEIIKAIYIPRKLHLTIFYDKNFNKDEIKRIVLKELDDSKLQNSVDTLSFYVDSGDKLIEEIMK